jgi:hypothetical protein
MNYFFRRSREVKEVKKFSINYERLSIMKKIVVIVFAGLLVSAGLQAQKVCIENNKVILDMTVAAGMPAGAITNVSKINSTGSLADNLQVFQKLEIAPSDLGSMNWTDAMAGCKNKGAGWRLPTLRELLLIYIFKDALDTAFSGLSPKGDALSYTYWSATEGNVSNAGNVTFTGNVLFIGHTTSASKATKYSVRCVREVTTP